MKEMLQVSIDEVSEGAELAADVLDGKGRVLIKAGTELNADKLAALRRHDIGVLTILADQELSTEEIELRRKEIARQVESRFAGHGDSDLMQRLKAAVLTYRSEVLR